MAQLGYIIGQENLDKTLNRYYDEWAFKHPTPNDFIRVAEKVSGLSWIGICKIGRKQPIPSIMRLKK